MNFPFERLCLDRASNRALTDFVVKFTLSQDVNFALGSLIRKWFVEDLFHCFGYVVPIGRAQALAVCLGVCLCPDHMLVYQTRRQMQASCIQSRTVPKGRFFVSKRVMVRIPVKLYEALKKRAEAEKRTIQAQLELLLDKALK